MKLSLPNAEITNNIVKKISEEIHKRNWSMLRLSDESGVPYNTIKKLLTYRIENPNFCNIAKISYTLNLNFNYLIGINNFNSNEDEYCHIANLSKLMLELEKSITITKTYRKNDFIPVYIPLTNNLNEQFNSDSLAMTTIAVDGYRERFGFKLSFGIKIRTNTYHPIYYENDIILIGTDRAPLSGETGIFIKEGHLYIRRFKSGNFLTLEPVNTIGTPIYLSSFDGWMIAGYVLGVYR